ncbi:MAG TPA: aminoglycoside phosphotransferase family protein [Ktedonobacteraceae bacterium]|nr:aminoglycoside phosphotransferase family protein [Ktedonobacteraceae bacterium]
MTLLRIDLDKIQPMPYNASMKKADHPRTILVPERVRLRAEQSDPQTRQWLKDLPGLIAELEQAWELSIGQPLSGGSSAYVAPVTTASGNAVIKIDMPIQHGSYSFQQEIDTLLRANGHGYVRVFKVDYERRAVLLEQLGLSMQERQLAPQQAIPLLCKTLQQVWLVPPRADQTIHASEYKAQTLAQLISELWDKLERPCTENIVAQALGFARRRMDAFDPQRCVVVHGDPHPANALLVPAPRAGAESGYVFVDPEGFLCEPEYDLGVVLRDWNEELLAAADPLAVAHEYCQLLATETGLDETTIWEWGFIERVSSGLYIYAYGSSEHGQPFFKTAQRLLDN